MIELLNSKPFMAGATIIAWSAFGIFVRFASRNDRYRTLVLSEMEACVYGLLFILIAIWMISTLIPKKGWQEDNETNFLWGVVIPNLLCIYCMLFFFTTFNFLS